MLKLRMPLQPIATNLYLYHCKVCYVVVCIHPTETPERCPACGSSETIDE